MNYLLYLIFGLLPSLIWLAYFLRKDVHPESAQMVIKIFSWGMIITLPAVFLEIGIFEQIKGFSLPWNLVLVLYLFLGVSLTEEVLKYLVVKEKVISDPEFDEPLDAMLYMIISALGFAAFENILILFNIKGDSLATTIFTVTAFRFIGATFLHALCSGTVGYFLALSFFAPKKKSSLFLSGLTIAISLHGLYNFSIIQMKKDWEIFIPFLILAVLALIVYLGFKRLKKIESICQIK